MRIEEERPLHRATAAERLARIATERGIALEELGGLFDGRGLDLLRADKMIENCVGIFGLPLGIGTDLRVNGQDYLVPMVVEEPSVVAAMSRAAKLVARSGGFVAEADPAVMIAQVQLLDVPDLEAGSAAILERTQEILAIANERGPSLVRRGKGAHALEVRVFHAPRPMLVVHLLVDCADAMGANAVNTMAEAVAPRLATLSRGRALLRILSNLADRRLARARFVVEASCFTVAGWDGSAVVDDIVAASDLAVVDPYRAATHNKGIMNGIDAVAIATGNDWRSVEAGAHAYAARGGCYSALSTFERERDCLVGSIELPLAVATVGGSTAAHPLAPILRRILGVESARELACVMASVGLAQNLGALRALATDGIQRGHMRLHARSVALAAGASGAEVESVAAAMVASGRIRLESATELLTHHRGGAA